MSAAGFEVVRRRGEWMLEQPYPALLSLVVLVLVLEDLRGSRTFATSQTWPVLQALVGVLAFLVVWRHEDRLRLGPVLALVLAAQIGWIVLHLILGVQSDSDSIHVYPREGNALLAGHYPSSEYPPGAVVLFALEALLAGRSPEGVRIVHAFLMVPFLLVTVAAVWSLRTRWSPFFAALVGLCPLNAFFVEFKFDPAPTAALAVGLALAWRNRWLLSGVAFGLGAALKWTPGLSALVLALWLVGSKRRRVAILHLLGCAGTFAAINAVFVALWIHAVLHAYWIQDSRGITGESFAYLPLRALKLASLSGGVWSQATVPGWANAAAIAFQTLFLGVLAAATIRARHRRDAAVALAGVAPAAFLLTNRVFSPQYLVTITAAWAVAGALLVRGRRAEARIGLLIFGATLANVLVYPTLAPRWTIFSALLFTLAFLLTLSIVAASVGSSPAGALPQRDLRLRHQNRGSRAKRRRGPRG
jgi:Glycosyltransferase family 87